MQSCLGTDYLLNQLYRGLHALRAPESFTRLIQEAAYSSGTGGRFPKRYAHLAMSLPNRASRA